MVVYTLTLTWVGFLGGGVVSKITPLSKTRYNYIRNLKF